MARPNQEAIETLMTITGVSESVAAQKLEEHGGDLNEAVNAHFNEGNRNVIQETSTNAAQNMDVDEPIQAGSQGTSSLISSNRNLNPFSVLGPSFRSLFDSGPDFTNHAPLVSHPRKVREIPIEVKDGNNESGNSDLTATIEDVTGAASTHGPATHGTVIGDDDDDEAIPIAPSEHNAGQNEQRADLLGNNSHGTCLSPSAPGIDDFPGYSHDIEGEMIRAAIETSRWEDLGDPITQRRLSRIEDAELAHAVSLSLKMAEREKALRELMEKVGASELEAYKSTEVGDMGRVASLSGRQSRFDAGSTSIQDEAEDTEEQPLVRHRSRRVSSSTVDSDKEVGEAEISPPSSPQHRRNIVHPLHNGNDYHSDRVWGGISSEEHDEAVMLEAALFGGIPEAGYRFPYAPHQFRQNGLDRTLGLHPQQIPRPPSPGLAAQRLIREQQDDEYLASLQADREKELKGMEEAEALRMEEQAAREAALEEERRKEEESLKKLEEEQEINRQLAAKEASLPHEPTSEDDNVVTLLVRMPDGSRRGRRFLKSDKLQSLFDFIDVGRGVKPGKYRLVRPFPRRAFSNGESASTFNELGLISKQEALFLELI